MRYVFACGFRINVQENHNSMISDPRMIDDAADCVCYAVEYAYTILTNNGQNLKLILLILLGLQ